MAVVILLLGLLLLFSSASTPITVSVAAKVSEAAVSGRIEDPSLCVVDIAGEPLPLLLKNHDWPSALHPISFHCLAYCYYYRLHLQPEYLLPKSLLPKRAE